MIYLISLGGVALGFVIYMLCAAFGITAFVVAVPYAYDALRLGGVAYLLYLAWQAIKPGGRAPFHLRALPRDGPRRLFLMGLLTNLLSPKIAVMYLSLLPQFIHPENGSVLARRPVWADVQRWLMGTVLAGLALRMVAEARR